MEYRNDPLAREEELYERRLKEAREKRDRSHLFIQELLASHPEIALTTNITSTFNERVGWKIVASAPRDPMEKVVPYKNNCFAMLDDRGHGIVSVIVFDVDFNVKKRFFTTDSILKERAKKISPDTSRYTTNLKKEEKVLRFGKARHHVCLTTKGGFLNIFDFNLNLEEERRYIFRVDDVGLDEFYFETHINPKAVVEVKGQLYYLHEDSKGITLYHCQSGEKKFTLKASELQKVFVRKNHIIVVCSCSIISIKCEEIPE